MAFFVALVARDPASLADLATTSTTTPSKHKSNAKLGNISLVDTLFALLANSSDPLAVASTQDKNEQDVEFRKMGVGKKDRGLVSILVSRSVNDSYAYPRFSSPRFTRRPSQAPHYFPLVPMYVYFFCHAFVNLIRR